MSVRKRLSNKSPMVSTVAVTAKTEERASMILASSYEPMNWIGINLEHEKFGAIFLEVLIDWNFLKSMTLIIR